MDAVPLLHMALALPTAGVGNAFTVILTESDFEHPVDVIVSVTL